MKKANKGNETRISDLPAVPKIDVAQQGVLSSEQDVEDHSVNEQTVKDIKDWNEELKL